MEHDANRLRRFRRGVRQWYDAHGRMLPWRKSHDPYRIWISEIMLQQTTVAAVIPYFERFLSAFPTVEKLAAAEQTDVLKLWEGLGYYSRARNLHATAQTIVSEMSGVFPQQAEELIKLKGVGRYTAGAIASFAFDEPAPIVEANTQRLYSRILGETGDPKSTAVQRRLWEFAELIVPPKEPGKFNQALMEIGSQVCSIEAPQCPTCPVRSCCAAFRDGKVSEIPPKKIREKPTPLTDATVAVRKGNRYLLRKRQEGEWWTGVWDFPRLTLASPLPSTNLFTKSHRNGQKQLPIIDETATEVLREIEQHVLGQTGVQCEVQHLNTEIRHTVTRYRIQLLCFTASYRSGKLKTGEETQWFDYEQLAALPMSKTGRQFVDLLRSSP
ncbi:A/G-specific adenine glycosylase [Calycomorphotria hydatis]|uniref:Adenine DNA glycosylase n=1 Tax=Calycomorphotria hydatis TaxID=2528027 RepID=A0A517TE03_9PLAN|nr:A/G-specific adenine glycosylase [Calycomorphotria hydatis]QDT66597.1 putative A/G-specific adenine glycosylase YfhQ [Calycomorphotria hydatis]